MAEITERVGVSTPQLAIGYALQLGLLRLPKTTNVAHMSDRTDRRPCE